MEPISHHVGLDGFVWWIGVVESIDDPLKVGRAKIRALGYHTEELSTYELPWALALAPTTQATNVANYKPGDWVLGFFMDGHLAQQPVALGVFPAIPQGSTGATAAATIAQTLTPTGI